MNKIIEFYSNVNMNKGLRFIALIQQLTFLGSSLTRAVSEYKNFAATQFLISNFHLSHCTKTVFVRKKN